MKQVIEDLSYVVLLRKKFSYIESIPGVLLPHPSSSAYPFKVDGYATPETWPYQNPLATPTEYYDHFNQPMKITPSMSSLEALLSKLPSVVPPQNSGGYCESQQLSLSQYVSTQRPMEFIQMEKVAKEETGEEYRTEHDVGESSSSMSGYHHHQHHHIWM